MYAHLAMLLPRPEGSGNELTRCLRNMLCPQRNTWVAELYCSCLLVAPNLALRLCAGFAQVLLGVRHKCCCALQVEQLQLDKASDHL